MTGPRLGIVAVLSGRRLGLAAVAALVVAGLACHPPARRGGFDFERMRNQLRYDPYEASPFFADGRTMRAPPAGTVPWRADSAAAEAGAGAGVAGASDRIPIPIDAARLAEGRDRYRVFCAVCHGAAGFGGSIVAANLVPTRPFSLRSAATRSRSPGYLYRVVTDGIGRMPAMAWQLPPDQRWAVVAYLGRLLAGPATDAAGRADSVQALRNLAIDSSWMARRARLERAWDSAGGAGGR